MKWQKTVIFLKKNDHIRAHFVIGVRSKDLKNTVIEIARCYEHQMEKMQKSVDVLAENKRQTIKQPGWKNCPPKPGNTLKREKFNRYHNCVAKGKTC